MADYTLDARHLLCPMPVIKTQIKVKKLVHGDRLTVLATDPGAAHDLPSWIRIHGHRMLDCRHEDNELKVLIEIIKDKE